MKLSALLCFEPHPKAPSAFPKCLLAVFENIAYRFANCERGVSVGYRGIDMVKHRKDPSINLSKLPVPSAPPWKSFEEMKNSRRWLQVKSMSETGKENK